MCHTHIYSRKMPARVCGGLSHTTIRARIGSIQPAISCLDVCNIFEFVTENLSQFCVRKSDEGYYKIPAGIKDPQIRKNEGTKKKPLLVSAFYATPQQ